MPTYEYRCENGHSFEALQRMADDPKSESGSSGSSSSDSKSGDSSSSSKSDAKPAPAAKND